MSLRRWKQRLFQRFDERMTIWQKKGFKAANRMHRYAVNGILIYLAYQVFDILRSYNDLFLHVRQTNRYEETDLEGPINKDDQ